MGCPESRERLAVCAVPAPLEVSAFNTMSQTTIAERFQSRPDTNADGYLGLPNRRIELSDVWMSVGGFAQKVGLVAIISFCRLYCLPAL
jgi:hypothetical protein